MTQEIRFMGLKEVMRLTNRSRASIYRDMETGDFPQSICIGPRSVAWRSDQIDLWIKQKIARTPTVKKAKYRPGQRYDN